MGTCCGSAGEMLYFVKLWWDDVDGVLLRITQLIELHCSVEYSSGAV